MLRKAAMPLLVLICVVWGSSLYAADRYPYFDPQRGYNIKEDNRPWYDGKFYPYWNDMFNGKSIKPQEQGTYQKFPEQSVPVRRVLGKMKTIYDPVVPEGERWSKPKNPGKATPASIVKGRWLFNTYCAICHGQDGLANTVPVQKGMPAPPIAGIFASKSPEMETHLYNKIRYGSFFQNPRGVMPAYGFQTSVKDRWDMVNYMMSPQFGK